MEHALRISLEQIHQRLAEQNIITKERLTLEETAIYLSKSRSYLYKKTSSRQIPFYKIGKSIYFLRSEIDAWVLQHKKDTI